MDTYKLTVAGVERDLPCANLRTTSILPRSSFLATWS